MCSARQRGGCCGEKAARSVGELEFLLLYPTCLWKLVFMLIFFVQPGGVTSIAFTVWALTVSFLKPISLCSGRGQAAPLYDLFLSPEGLRGVWAGPSRQAHLLFLFALSLLSQDWLSYSVWEICWSQCPLSVLPGVAGPPQCSCFFTSLCDRM